MKKIRNTFKQIFDPVFLKGGEQERASIQNGWHKTWKERKVFLFTWEYCSHCDCMFVRCPMCGNNCCNAGHGRVTKDLKPLPTNDVKEWKRGKDCPVCRLAYQYQDLAYQTKTVPPRPSKKEIARREKEQSETQGDKALKKIFWEV